MSVHEIWEWFGNLDAETRQEIISDSEAQNDEQLLEYLIVTYFE